METEVYDGVENLPGHVCWELLRGHEVGRLAVVVDGAPDIFPVNYVVDHGSLVFRSAGGRKVAAALAGPVAFEVDGVDGDRAWSVVVTGSAREIRRLPDVVDALALPLHPWQAGTKDRLVRVEPHGTAGRRFPIA